MHTKKLESIYIVIKKIYTNKSKVNILYIDRIDNRKSINK
jgi:hypothetical protein